MDVHYIDCQVPLWKGDVAEEVPEPGESTAGVGDGRRDESDLSGEGLHGPVVADQSALDGHAGRAIDAEVGLVEGEKGVGAVVGDGVRGSGEPVDGE